MTRGLHSGPTVVDDAKVAEVLKKLRSLDRPPGPLTGVTEVVVDANSSEPTRIDSGPIRDRHRRRRSRSAASAAARTPTRGRPACEDMMYPLAAAPRRSAAA